MSDQHPTFKSLIPFFIFVSLFLALHIIYYDHPAYVKSGFALFSCLTAFVISLFTFRKKLPLSQKIEIFLEGTSQITIQYMLYIFVLSSVFAHIMEKIGALDTAVTLGLSSIHTATLLPGLFIIISLFSFAIGSSMGSIATFMPLALGFGEKLGINSSLLAGTVVGASMLGDNLSLISDTTIAALRVTQSSMKDKFRENALFVIPAFFITFGILFMHNYFFINIASPPLSTLTPHSLLPLFPYLGVFILALIGIDVLAVLLLGILGAATLGFFTGIFSFPQATSFLFEGFYQQPGMINVFLLVMVIAGLSKVIEYNGGIDYVITKLAPRASTTSSYHAERAIALLTFFVNLCIAINTISILIVGPLARKIGDHSNIPRYRIASLIDIVACLAQGLAPYTPQLLLAGALAHISSISILPYLYYQYALGCVTIISIMMKK